MVDYFENVCLDSRSLVFDFEFIEFFVVSCPDFTTLHWIRTDDFLISHEKDVVIESMSLEECKAICIVRISLFSKVQGKAFRLMK